MGQYLGNGEDRPIALLLELEQVRFEEDPNQMRDTLLSLSGVKSPFEYSVQES